MYSLTKEIASITGLNATSTCTLTVGTRTQPLTHTGEFRKAHFGARGVGCLGLNEPWGSDISGETSAQGSFKVLPIVEQVTQEWHNRLCTWARWRLCVCSHVHAFVSLLCLCGKDTIRSKSNSGRTRPKCHIYLLHCYWIISAGNKCSQCGQSVCDSQFMSFLANYFDTKKTRMFPHSTAGEFSEGLAWQL